MNVQEVLKQLNIDPRCGKTRAIQEIGERIMSDSRPIDYANTVIVKLGGEKQQDFPTARIVCKALIEQAVQGEKPDPKIWMEYAYAKVQKLRREMPFVFHEQGGSEASSLVTTVQKPKKSRGGDKKTQAIAICDQNSSLTNGQLAKLIEKEMGISYANAHYYVARVWKRK